MHFIIIDSRIINPAYICDAHFTQETVYKHGLTGAEAAWEYEPAFPWEPVGNRTVALVTLAVPVPEYPSDDLGTSTSRTLRFTGESAEALRSYLRAQSLDLTPANASQDPTDVTRQHESAV